MASSKSALLSGRRHVCLLGATSAFAVACGSPNEQPATESGEEIPPVEFGGTFGPAPMIAVSELPESLPSTTPDAVTLELRTNIDHIGVRVHINAAGGIPITNCQSADLYRIGRDAVDWPVGGKYVLPLSYDRVLAPGVYTQDVRLYLNGGYLDTTLVTAGIHYFEVAEGRLHPITSTEYSNFVTPVMYGPDGEPYYAGSSLPEGYESSPEPCREPEPYSDEVTTAEAISSVNFDSWQDVHTIQPLRWLPPETFSNGATSEQSVVFRARSAAGGRLRVEISAPLAELGADFDASLVHEPDPEGNHGRVILDEPGGTSWHSTGGTLRVDVRDEGQLSIELSEVELAKLRMVTEPEVTRTLPTGAISGLWIVDSVH